MNVLTHLLREITSSDMFNTISKNDEIDEIYFSEICDMLEIFSSNPFDLYKELTYLYVRYTGTIEPYKEISPFNENNIDNKILYIISYFRAFTAYNIIEFYELLITETQKLMISLMKNKDIINGKVIDLIKKFTFKMNPEEKLINIETSLCELCEYVSYLRKTIENSKFAINDLESLICISIYFGYINREDTQKWEEFSNILIKVFNTYTNDGLRKDSFLNMNGIGLYEIFRMNDMLLRKFLRDINLWVLAGYRFRLDSMKREWDDIKEAIDREEFSLANLQKCRENLEEAKNVHSSYLFCIWNVNYINIKQAEKIIILYTWAEYKIIELQD